MKFRTFEYFLKNKRVAMEKLSLVIPFPSYIKNKNHFEQMLLPAKLDIESYLR